MKRIFTILTLAIMPFLANSVFAQDTIVSWSFPSTSADSLVDKSIALNSSRYISCQYGTYGTTSYHAITIDYTTNGYLGSPDKSAKTIGWNDGTDSAYYMVKFKTTGYGSLKLSSKQQAGGSNPGPRDFKVQYKLTGSTSPWIDITGGTIICANDWTTGVLNGIDIPSACDNQSSQLSIRWLQTSNLDYQGNVLLATGISKIDDIVVTGTVITGIDNSDSERFINIYPNPNKGNFCIENNGEIAKISVYTILGKCIYTNANITESRTEFTDFEKGMYLVQITTNDNDVYTHKLIVE
jgi:hypothetical protein